MLEVKLLISDLDYDGVVDLVVPAVSQKLSAKGGLVGRIAGKKEKLLAAAHRFLAIAAKKRSRIVEKVSALAEKKGVTVQICDISVRKI